MTDLKQLRASLTKLANPKLALQAENFFKTGKGEYAEGDKFLGIYVPILRKIAKDFTNLPLKDLAQLLSSKFNEERLMALFILVRQYQTGALAQQNELFKFYLQNIKYINNWNLVDSSAPYIVGHFLLDKDKEILPKLAESKNLWERRIAIVVTLYFIKKEEYSYTLKIAKILMNDSHDLIHKAVGWMLREVGKKDQGLLEQFLDAYANIMPRTMLRYAIEKFSEAKRKKYLLLKKQN